MHKHGHMYGNWDVDEEEGEIIGQQLRDTQDQTTYNISDYRHTCRTCKDMEVEAYELLSTKKTYKKGSLMNVPNIGFSKTAAKKSAFNTTSASVLKPVRPTIDKEKARKAIDEAKGKVAPMPRYNVTQLKKISLD